MSALVATAARTTAVADFKPPVQRLVRLTALAAAFLLSACAVQDPQLAQGPLNCQERLNAFEAFARSRALPPAYPLPVPGEAALAADRLLASVQPQSLSDAQWRDWLSRMASAAAGRRAIQWAALGADGRAQWLALDAGGLPGLERCAAQRLVDLQATADPTALPDVVVPDAYLTMHRVIGLYPLTTIGVRQGVAALHEETREVFATPIDVLPVSGTLQRYVPRAAATAATGEVVVDEPLARDSLGAIAPRGDALQILLDKHAPVWEVDTASDADLPGAPRFAGVEARVGVDGASPTVYRYLSQTRFDGAWRLQLNYLVWFDRRPARNSLDTLAGRLDGLLWRVTLDGDGEPLLYDSIHPCGCYHLFFPTSRLTLREDAASLPEPPLVAQTVPSWRKDERLVLRVASGSHYLQRVGYWPGAGASAQPYDLRPYEDLYAVPGPDGRTSLFAAHGLVPGTERGERFYLWPMGVRSPGAMRERGTQATAFLGRRHFDDADLLDSLFERSGLQRRDAAAGR